MVKPIALQPRRRASSTLAGDRRQRRFGVGVEQVVVVGLEDQRDLAGVVGRAGLDEAERRRVGVAAGVDGELEVVAGIEAVGVGREAARGAVLEALVDRQHDELAGAGQTAAHEEAVEVGLDAGALGAVPGKDLL